MKEPKRAFPFACPVEAASILRGCPGFTLASDIGELVELSCRDAVNGWHEMAYDVPGKGRVVEAVVCRVNTGIAANDRESYMRRRDSECLVYRRHKSRQKNRVR